MHKNLVAALSIVLAVPGCGYFPESCFELSPESRPPIWLESMVGPARKPSTISMCYYSSGKAVFTLRGAYGTSKEIVGEVRDSQPLQLSHPPAGFQRGYPSYALVTFNGIADIIEHRRMEPVFYTVDDPLVWKEFGVSR